MAEESNLTRFIKLVTAILAAGGFVWGVTAFLITKRLEARASFLDYQLELYQETANVASILANESPETANWQEAHKRFLELYWGDLVLVETPLVEAQMSIFKVALDNKSPYMRSHSYCLAHELRASLSKSWNVVDWEFSRDVPETCVSLDGNK